MSLLADWRTWPADKKRLFLERARAERARRLQMSWQPYPWQRAHAHPTGWTGVCTPACNDLPDLPPLGALDTFLMMGGRGTGKTDGCAEYVIRHVNGPACDPRAPGGHRVAIVAPTQGDAVEACVTGISGLIAHDPRIRLGGGRGGSFAGFPNGARARLFGAHTADDINRLRAGGNNCLVWVEEAAAQRYLGEVLEHSAFGLRVGPAPHYVMSTTPKNRPEIKALVKDPHVHITRGKTADATHLDSAFRDRILMKYAGTTTGRQELDGELLDDVDGALWKRYQIDTPRVDPLAELVLRRVVVGLDPNAGGPDECGIVVMGLAQDLEPDARGYPVLHLYVLEDASKKFANPGQWGAAAVAAYKRWGADAIIAEVNNGGDMVPHVIRGADPTANVRTVHATRGKIVRAEPVQALYEQGRVHHVGMFPVLEDQMTTWTPDSSDSPDRMDALVWAATDLAKLATTGDGTQFAMA